MKATAADMDPLSRALLCFVAFLILLGLVIGWMATRGGDDGFGY